MISIRDFIKVVLKSVILTFCLVDMICKDLAAFIEISFTKFYNILNEYTNNVAASIPIHTGGGIFLKRGIHPLLKTS